MRPEDRNLAQSNLGIAVCLNPSHHCHDNETGLCKLACNCRIIPRRIYCRLPVGSRNTNITGNDRVGDVVVGREGTWSDGRPRLAEECDHLCRFGA